MKNTIRRCGLISAIFLCSFGNHLQAASPLTWDDCLSIAQKNNPTLRSSIFNEEASQATYRSSYNGLFPKLNLTNSYTTGHNPNSDTRWRAGASASMDIFNLSEIEQIKLSSAEYKEKQAATRDTSSLVLFNLKRAFATLLYSQEQISVSKKIIELRDRNAQLVTLRYKSGRESLGNMQRAQAELFEAQTALKQADRDLKSAQRELAHQLGATNYLDTIATGTLITADLGQNDPDLLSLTNEHPSVMLQEATVGAARARLHQSASVFLPTLSASYTRSFVDRTEFPGNPDWTASGVISLPIFGNGPTSGYYSTLSSKRGVQAAEADLRATRDQVQSDIVSAWSDLGGAIDQVLVQKNFLDAAIQRNEEADIRYSSGLLSYENWELIVSDHVNFERALLRAKRDAVIAEATWNRAIGKGYGN